MTDPFTSLRPTTERVEPDSRFREALLSNVRTRLASGDNSLSSAPTIPTSALPITLEVTHMKPNSQSRTRALLMAAAVVVLMAGAVAIVLVRRDSADDSISTTVPPTVPAATVLPNTVLPTTTLPSPTDHEIAAAVLLPAKEYAPGWIYQSDPSAPEDLLRADIASAIDACAAYIADVFDADDSATVKSRVFHHGPPTDALFGENVLVFATEDAAVAMFDAINDPAFAACGAAYNEKSINCPVEAYSGCIVEGFGSTPVATPFEPVGDQLRFSRYESTWVHPLTGETHGPETVLGATLRVGRVLVFTGTLQMGDVDAAERVEVVSDEQFRQTLVNIADRATAAQAG